ncbi:hypothetical protein SUGI_0067830 [Cryptomeria japonica]|nr:hypothetical protein SUGI_0067830 [Cryptomeria japonica]
MCKLPTSDFFTNEFGLPLTMTPNFEGMICEMVYGQPPPPHDGDPAFKLPCYAMVVVEKLCVLVDFWITFNKPNVFALTEYCTGGQTNLSQAVAMVLSQGVFKNDINRMQSSIAIGSQRQQFPRRLH